MGLDEEKAMTTAEDKTSPVSITEYESGSALTDQFDNDALAPLQIGLFGEVGSLMATSKKYHREGEAYAGYRDAVVEEFGDTLWYLASLCRRLGFKLEEIVVEASKREGVSFAADTSALAVPPMEFGKVNNQVVIDDTLIELGQHAATLLKACIERAAQSEHLIAFTRTYLRAVQTCEIPFDLIAQTNLAKTQGRFLDRNVSELPDFDAGLPEAERLPDTFRIEIKQREHGKSYLRWNGVFIGDPLTDNIEDPDGYRFHDVFHLAHAAVLHWSPTFRGLIRQKRKSVAGLDENQDGGRASVIEEGLIAYIFSCAKELKFFEGQSSVSFDLLKIIKNFVRGYEVDRCPLKLWENAILQGYSAFRLLKSHSGGTIVGNRASRTITYEVE